MEAARQYGAIDPSTEKTLFSLSGCRTALQGTYILDGRMVLLLEAENRNASAWSLYLGQASTDGKPAVLGQTRNPWMEMLDNRRKSHGLEPLEGGEERGAAIRLEAGEKKSFYVSVVPADKNQTEVYELAFHAFLYDTEQPLEYVYTDEIRISTEEPAPLQEGIMAVASAEDYRIREGQAAQPEPGGTLSRDAFPLPEDRAEPFRLRFPRNYFCCFAFFAARRRLRPIRIQLPASAASRTTDSVGRGWFASAFSASCVSPSAGAAWI